MKLRLEEVVMESSINSPPSSSAMLHQLSPLEDSSVQQRCDGCGHPILDGNENVCNFCQGKGDNASDSKKNGDIHTVITVNPRSNDSNRYYDGYSGFVMETQAGQPVTQNRVVSNGRSSHHIPCSEDSVRIARKWEFFPGKNRFYCNGRVMTAPSIRFCVLSLGLILITFVLFIIFDAPYLSEKLTVAIPIVGSLLFISVMVNMVKTSCSDPGILPRASQQEAEFIEKSYAVGATARPPPRTKDIVVNGQVIKSKYCFTCKMFRPPRASHCGVCDNCVDRFDHHCPFLGNCIGKRNYRSFYAFIVSLSLLAVFVLTCSITHLALLSKDKGNFLESLRESPASAVVVLISFFGMWTVIGLAGFHTYLIALEQTTNEDIKGMFGRANAKNPFSRGNICQNCCFVLCGPVPPSLIDPRGYATPEFLSSLPRKNDLTTSISPTRCNLQQLRPNHQYEDANTPISNPIIQGSAEHEQMRQMHSLHQFASSPSANPKILPDASSVSVSPLNKMPVMNQGDVAANGEQDVVNAMTSPAETAGTWSSVAAVVKSSARPQQGVVKQSISRDQFQNGYSNSTSELELEDVTVSMMDLDLVATTSRSRAPLTSLSATSLPVDNVRISHKIRRSGIGPKSSDTMMDSPLHLDTII